MTLEPFFDNRTSMVSRHHAEVAVQSHSVTFPDFGAYCIECTSYPGALQLGSHGIGRHWRYHWTTIISPACRSVLQHWKGFFLLKLCCSERIIRCFSLFYPPLFVTYNKKCYSISVLDSGRTEQHVFAALVDQAYSSDGHCRSVRGH